MFFVSSDNFWFWLDIVRCPTAILRPANLHDKAIRISVNSLIQLISNFFMFACMQLKREIPVSCRYMKIWVSCAKLFSLLALSFAFLHSRQWKPTIYHHTGYLPAFTHKHQRWSTWQQYYCKAFYLRCLRESWIPLYLKIIINLELRYYSSH